jgi:hypothetical protein
MSVNTGGLSLKNGKVYACAQYGRFISSATQTFPPCSAQIIKSTIIEHIHNSHAAVETSAINFKLRSTNDTVYNEKTHRTLLI